MEKQVFHERLFFHVNRLVMPVFDLTINIIVLFVLLVSAMLTGFGLRSRQLAKKNRQIMALEKEVMQVSAEILQVQKEYCELESRLKNLSIPVIPIKQATAATVVVAKDHDLQKDVTDTSSRENISNRTA